MTEQMQPINLVNQVASAISYSADPDNDTTMHWKPEAYAAVRAVADWLNDQNNGISSWTYLKLQKELDQYDQHRISTPSLKEQALQELNKVDMLWATEEFGQETLNSLNTIRKALEALPDD